MAAALRLAHMDTRIDSAWTYLLVAEARLQNLRTDLAARDRLDARAKHDLANALTLVISSRDILTHETLEPDLLDEAEAAVRRAMEIALGVAGGAAH